MAVSLLECTPPGEGQKIHLGTAIRHLPRRQLLHGMLPDCRATAQGLGQTCYVDHRVTRMHKGSTHPSSLQPECETTRRLIRMLVSSHTQPILFDPPGDFF